MIAKSYEDFCTREVSACATSLRSQGVDALVECLTRRMREHFGSSYDEKVGSEVARKIALNYY